MNKKYTEFNGLHLPTIEAEILAAWKAEQAFEQSVTLREGKNPFCILRGTPKCQWNARHSSCYFKDLKRYGLSL